jgi:two-component system sensor histidine kinase BaeS
VLGGRPVGAIILRPPENPENGNRESSFLSSVNRSLLVSVAVTGSAAVLLALGLSRRILRPVEALTQAARAVGAGDLSRRVGVTTDDEIGELAQAFNSMAESLARLEQPRRNLVTDVAHELRTPLSNVRAYLEGMCDGVIEPSPEAIASIYEEALLLSKLVDDLQELSLAEAGAMKLHRRPLALLETVTKALAAAKGISLATDLPPDLPLVDADPDRVGQVLRNLLSNAVAHTATGGHVLVRARPSGAEVQVTVQDDGEGIPEKHLPHIFDRFYRADDSRARTTGGSGLGLAIAQQLVQAHGGRIWAESTEGEGSLFHFTLPIAPGDAEVE